MLARKCFGACIFVLMALNIAYTQVIFEGVVTDSGSEPVHDALVELTDQTDTSRIFIDYTNLRGRYRLQLETTAVDGPNTCYLYQNFPNQNGLIYQRIPLKSQLYLYHLSN